MRQVLSALACASIVFAGAASAQPAPPAPAPAAATSARIVMLRLFTADLARGEKFYREVLGTTVVQKMGAKVSIMIFPGGATPGIILIQSPSVAQMKGSFVVQVPDMEGVLARAAANGGRVMATQFGQDVQGSPARSRHFTDPDGNDIEVLQIGGSRPPKP